MTDENVRIDEARGSPDQRKRRHNRSQILILAAFGADPVEAGPELSTFHILAGESLTPLAQALSSTFSIHEIQLQLKYGEVQLPWFSDQTLLIRVLSGIRDCQID